MRIKSDIRFRIGIQHSGRITVYASHPRVFTTHYPKGQAKNLPQTG